MLCGVLGVGFVDGVSVFGRIGCVVAMPLFNVYVCSGFVCA